MIYSNIETRPTEKEMDWGILTQIEVGEYGRGRRMMCLPCRNDIEIKKGMNADITIGLTKNGRPRINKGTDSNLYMLLSSEGGYTRRGDGTIKVLKSQKQEFEVLARGNGADGAAGRIGTWDCMLVKVPLTNAVVRVRTSGGGYGRPSDLYFIHEGKVYHCLPEDREECCEALGIEVPFTMNEDNEFNAEEWIIL